MSIALLSPLRDATIPDRIISCRDEPNGLIYDLGSLEIILFMTGFILAIWDYLLKCCGLFLNFKKVSFKISNFLG